MTLTAETSSSGETLRGAAGREPARSGEALAANVELVGVVHCLTTAR